MQIEKYTTNGFENRAETELSGILKPASWILDWVIPCGV